MSVDGQALNRLWLFFQYGWGRYGGWGVSALTLLFTFLTMMKIYLNTPVWLDLAVILAGGVVFAVAMIVIGRRAMAMNRGIVSMEHAMITANNPVWRKYIDSYVALVNYLLELEEFVVACGSNNMDGEKREILIERLGTARGRLAAATAELLTEWERNKLT